jgi:hypothetical protein
MDTWSYLLGLYENLLYASAVRSYVLINSCSVSSYMSYSYSFGILSYLQFE